MWDLRTFSQDPPKPSSYLWCLPICLFPTSPQALTHPWSTWTHVPQFITHPSVGLRLALSPIYPHQHVQYQRRTSVFIGEVMSVQVCSYMFKACGCQRTALVRSHLFLRQLLSLAQNSTGRLACCPLSPRDHLLLLPHVWDYSCVHHTQPVGSGDKLGSSCLCGILFTEPSPWPFVVFLGLECHVAQTSLLVPIWLRTPLNSPGELNSLPLRPWCGVHAGL